MQTANQEDNRTAPQRFIRIYTLSMDKSDEESGKDADSSNDSAKNWDRDQELLTKFKEIRLNHAHWVFLLDKIFKMNALIRELSRHIIR